MKLSSVTAFYPCYNDAGTIPTMILRALQTLPQIADDYEVIVINDGSTDDSARILEEMACAFDHLRVIHHDQPSGYGGVLRAGFAAARNDWIFYTDGDAQYDARELALLAEQVRDGVDMVNGYKIKRHDPFHRIVIGLAYQYFVKFAFGLVIRDVDCDFRLMRRTIFDHITLESKTGTITFEMVKKIQDAGHQIVEVPVHHWYRQYGESQFFNFPRIARTLMALINWWWRLVVRKEHLRKQPAGSLETTGASLTALRSYPALLHQHYAAGPTPSPASVHPRRSRQDRRWLIPSPDQRLRETVHNRRDHACANSPARVNEAVILSATPSRSNMTTKFIVISLMLIALLLRLWGIGFGLPYEYHIDEHFYYPYAWAMGQGQLDLPDQSHGPSLYLASLLISQKIAHASIRPELSAAEFGVSIESDPAPVLLSDRMVSAIAGALTIPIVYLIGRRSRDRRTGLIAAALMTVLFFHVRDSHFGVPDAVMTLFAATTVWLALRAHHTAKSVDFFLAGLFAGLTAATKYTSALVWAPVILAAFRIPNSAFRVRHSVLLILNSTFGFLTGFLVGYPNVLINFPAFIKDIGFLWIRVGSGFEGWRIVPDNSALFYLFTLEWSIGLVTLIVSGIGIMAAIVRRTANDVILISFPLIYFIIVSLSRGHFGRYMLPILPMLVVLTIEVCLHVIPRFIAALTARARRHEDRRGSARLRGQLPPLIGILVLSAVFIPNTLNSLRFDWLLSQADTRTLAKQWIETHIEAGARIAVEWPYHTPPLSNGYAVPPNSQREYWLDLVYGFGLADRSIAQYQSDGTQFIIATSYIRNIPTEDTQQESHRQEFYQQLPKVFQEVKRLSPRCDGREPTFIFDQLYGPAIGLWDLCYAGPMITIYRVN